VEDSWWICPEDGTFNRHGVRRCRKEGCNMARPEEVGDHDEILVDLRNQFRQEYGCIVLARQKDVFLPTKLRGQPVLQEVENAKGLQDLDKLSVDQLKKKCRDAGLEVSGTVAELVARLKAIAIRAWRPIKPLHLSSRDFGLAYRRRKRLSDKLPQCALWGRRVDGVLEGDWVKCRLKKKKAYHLCECGQPLRHDALFCKRCAKAQTIECPTPECKQLVRPDQKCPKCCRQPDKDAVQLAYFTQNVFRHKQVMQKLEEEIQLEEQRKAQGKPNKADHFCAYLTKTINGKEVLKPIGQNGMWTATNENHETLKSKAEQVKGLRFRTAKDAVFGWGRGPGAILPWGSSVKGTDAGGDWVKCKISRAQYLQASLKEGVLPDGVQAEHRKEGVILSYDEFKGDHGLLGILREIGLSDPGEEKMRRLFDKEEATAARIQSERLNNAKSVKEWKSSMVEGKFNTGIDERIFKSMLFRLVPFLRANEEEVEEYLEFQRSSAQAAVPWCQDPTHFAKPHKACPFCREERAHLANLLNAGYMDLPQHPLVIRSHFLDEKSKFQQAGSSSIGGGSASIFSTGSAPSRKKTFRCCGSRCLFLKGILDKYKCCGTKVAPDGVDPENPQQGDMDEEEKTIQKRKRKRQTEERKKQWEMTRIQNEGVVPYFICIQTLVAFVLWFYGAVFMQDAVAWSEALGGAESFVPGAMNLRTHFECRDLRPDFWRAWTYQYTHAGFGHIFGNCIMNLLLGLRLNKLNGNMLMMWFYWAGVVGGACLYFVWDVHIATIGMSGGCYSLFGQRYGYLAINGKQKRYAWTEFIFLSLLIGADFINYAYSQLMPAENTTHVSHCAHVGGFVMGAMVVILFGRNLEEDDWEKKLKIVTYFLFAAFIGFCVIFRFIAWAPWDLQNKDPYCWVHLMYNNTLFGDTNWHCVKCMEHGCPDAVMTNQLWVANVSYAECMESPAYLPIHELDIFGNLAR
jgi:membrane associated rhomboid family serine protease